MYNIWQQEMTGKAEFSRAEQNRKIKVEEAKAEKESAFFRAEAEIIRAEALHAVRYASLGRICGNTMPRMPLGMRLSEEIKGLHT